MTRPALLGQGVGFKVPRCCSTANCTFLLVTMFWETDMPLYVACKMIRTGEVDNLDLWFKTLLQEKTPYGFLNRLHGDEKIGKELFCKQVCLLVWVASLFSQVPTAQQLEASLTFFYDKDLLLLARTGFGKTLLIVIVHLLQDPDEDYIIPFISPLKWLQTSQAQSFYDKYGIFTLAI